MPKPKEVAEGAQRRAVTPAMFHILLALADGDRHGYAIMQMVESSTHGEIRLPPGTLYRSIKRLLDDGFIDVSDQRPDEEEDDEEAVELLAEFRLPAEDVLPLEVLEHDHAEDDGLEDEGATERDVDARPDVPQRVQFGQKREERGDAEDEAGDGHRQRHVGPEAGVALERALSDRTAFLTGSRYSRRP